MIFDRLENSPLYSSSNEGIAAALRHLHAKNWIDTPPGKYEIDGKQLYAQVAEFETKPMEKGVWEAHRRYIDVHYVIQGSERMGHANLHRLQANDYNEETDFQVFQGEGNFFIMQPGTFAIMWPEDVHMPGMAAGNPVLLKKVVIKVKID